MAIKYVSKWTTRLRTSHGNYDLIWGDPCHVIGRSGSQTDVYARGMRGKVSTADLGNTSLLEVYIIDVGQGDGVLLKTPDDRWHLVDAGIRNENQDTRKGAANFLRWKFYEDLRRRSVDLESIIISHADADHFGGLINLLSGTLPAYGSKPQRRFNVSVNNLYHNGMGRFDGSYPLGRTRSGRVTSFPRAGSRLSTDGTFITELLNGKSGFRGRQFNSRSGFATLAPLIASVPQHVRRLSSHDEYVPGYRPGNGACTMRILGPIVEDLQGGNQGLRWLGSASKTRNGHSIVLRLDYGDARILLTGDLNTKSQRLLLSYHSQLEFTSDVVKGCHHGSDDIDLDFVAAMAGRATVISSGDNENYAHPRPRVLGASALYGREGVDQRGRTMPPLLYSTELARSIRLDYVKHVEVDYLEDDGNVYTVSGDAKDARVRAERDDSGDRLRELGTTPIAVDFVYGLVNVRTDGEHILFATMHEKGNTFDWRVIRAGTSPSG